MGKPNAAKPPMGILDAIYGRHSVRSYLAKPVDEEAVQSLLNAAVRAPTAIHEEPWAFVVVQNAALLQKLSDQAKPLFVEEMRHRMERGAANSFEHFLRPEFNIFHGATTLIVICAKPVGPFITADCWLAAENLMLAACAQGLGTCVIGFAVAALNTPEWKTELKIPAAMTAMVPIIVGVPAGETPPVPRQPPEIITWK